MASHAQCRCADRIALRCLAIHPLRSPTLANLYMGLDLFLLFLLAACFLICSVISDLRQRPDKYFLISASQFARELVRHARKLGLASYKSVTATSYNVDIAPASSLQSVRVPVAAHETIPVAFLFSQCNPVSLSSILRSAQERGHHRLTNTYTAYHDSSAAIRSSASWFIPIVDSKS
jgi:hypothetical protein